MSKYEFIEKYGDVKVKFVSYYKFTFVYQGEVDGKTITVGIGGNADDIYRLDVSPDIEISIVDLDPHTGNCGEDDFYEY